MLFRSLLVDTLIEDLSARFDGWDLWRELTNIVSKGFNELRDAEAHLIVVAHAIHDDNEMVGILPAISGKQIRTKLPAKLHDWIWFDFDGTRKGTERAFFLGPQKSWTHSGRNIRKCVVIKADVCALFEELGIEP